MSPNRQKMRVLVTLMVIALSGLIVLQLYLLNSALELKEQAFKQNVSAALLAATLRLQAGETVSQAFQVGAPDGSGPRRTIRSEIIVTGKEGAGENSVPLRKGRGTYFYRFTTDSEAVFAGVHNGTTG